MKKVIIRRQTFETNSSSTHSYSIIDNRTAKRIIPDSKGKVIISANYCVGENNATNDEYIKAVIAIPYYGYDAVLELIKKKTGAESVEFEGSEYKLNILKDETDGVFDGDYAENPKDNYTLEEFIFDPGVSVAYMMDGYDS